MIILGISNYDVYSGIIITENCIDVTHGDWPFDLHQKFTREYKGFRVTGIEWEPHKDKLIKKFIIDFIANDSELGEVYTGETKKVDSVQFLKSIHEGRTKFSL